MTGLCAGTEVFPLRQPRLQEQAVGDFQNICGVQRGGVISRGADPAPQGLRSARGGEYFANHYSARYQFLVFVSFRSIEGVEAPAECLGVRSVSVSAQGSMMRTAAGGEYGAKSSFLQGKHGVVV